ncbi:unnamed protein product [Rotaria sp. Silwood2]|nr:unnamed protein product [Rotaria sp. Silwood2]CAF4311239.1 unnamed protein product [Rotaria sp. Silwood2]
MVTRIFSSLRENENLTVEKNDSNSLHYYSPYNNVYISCDRQLKKIQNYFPYRSATSQRINDSDQTAFLFIKKQKKILNLHPGRFYVQQKTNMNGESRVQEYCRYRDAHNNGSINTTVFVDKHLQIPCYLQITKRNENEYSRYRNSNLSRDRSINRTDTRLKTHYKCRSLIYDSEAKVSKNKLFNNKQLILFAFLLKRFNVSDDKVSWNVDYPDYKPVEYTTTKIQRNPKADSCDPSKITKFNQVDNKIDRRSFTGFYYIDPITQRPRNPIGRTGMTGRGRLYHWGPNHAGDPVVTRWKRDENGSIVYRRINAHHHLKPVLEFVAIRRRDTKEWALPGGMVDPGENVSNTVMREFQEEALRDGLDENLIKRLFSKGYKLYESYVDDPRNTDNAWMETVAMHFHDETGQLTDHLDLHAGDDADKVVWCTVDRTLQLYASHKDFLKAAVDRFDAFW